MKDGGPAFPCDLPDLERKRPFSAGLSLRDYFAGQALAGICADRDATENHTAPSVADFCWELADEMLKARGEV